MRAVNDETKQENNTRTTITSRLKIQLLIFQQDRINIKKQLL